jgi:hypothetical protein
LMTSRPDEMASAVKRSPVQTHSTRLAVR